MGISRKFSLVKMLMSHVEIPCCKPKGFWSFGLPAIFPGAIVGPSVVCWKVPDSTKESQPEPSLKCWLPNSPTFLEACSEHPFHDFSQGPLFRKVADS